MKPVAPENKRSAHHTESISAPLGNCVTQNFDPRAFWFNWLYPLNF